MKFLLNQMGSVEDVRCSVRGCKDLEALQAALNNENSQKQPRATVVKMLEVAIRRARKEAQA